MRFIVILYSIYTLLGKKTARGGGGVGARNKERVYGRVLSGGRDGPTFRSSMNLGLVLLRESFVSHILLVHKFNELEISAPFC